MPSVLNVITMKWFFFFFKEGCPAVVKVRRAPTNARDSYKEKGHTFREGNLVYWRDVLTVESPPYSKVSSP